MAHKKAGGSSRNGRDSESKRLGVKAFGGEQVKAGNVKALFTSVVGSLMQKLMGGGGGWKGTIRDVVEKATGPLIDWLSGAVAK